MIRDELIQIAKETVSVCNSGHYTTRSGQAVNIKDGIGHSIEVSRIITFDNIMESTLQKTYKRPCHVLMTQCDTLSSIRFWNKEKGKRVIALNFASAKNPGGGFLNGSKAQEESIAYSSTLYTVLKTFDKYYDWNKKHLNRGLYNDRMILSPDVQIIRDEYLELDIPYYSDIITCPAVNRGAALRNGVKEIKIIEAMHKRIEFIIRTTIEYVKQYEIPSCVLILGAYGCGVFKNSPDIVADIFRKVLSEYDVILGHLNITVNFAIPGKNHFDTFKNIILR